MEFELGRTYAGYKFLDVVRRSRSAVQYRVQNTIAQRLESLQTLPAAATDDQDALELFLREVRVRAHLTHPHIVTFYTAMPVEGRMVMTTELYDGLPLTERLQLGPLPWRVALRVACQILDVLACLHQQCFVHCDITPENILVGPEEFCKLSSFALARPLGSANAPESGAVVGNPTYISPEQVKGGRELDQRSDLYSVGVVLYEMLCGRPPFESRSQFELMLAHVNQAPLPPSGVNREVPGFLDALVLRGLAKEPADRYPDAQSFSAALEAADEDSGKEAVAGVAESNAVVQAIPVVKGETVEFIVPAVAVLEVEPVAVAEAAEPVVPAVAVLEVEPVAVAEAAEPVVEAVAVSEVEPVAIAEAPEPVVEAVAVLEVEPVAVAEDPEPVVEAVAALEVEPVAVAEAPEPVVEAVAALEVEPVAVAEAPEPVVEVVVPAMELVATAEAAEPVLESVAALEVMEPAVCVTAGAVVEVASSLAIPVAVAEPAVPLPAAVAALEVEPLALAEAAEPVVEVAEASGELVATAEAAEPKIESAAALKVVEPVAATVAAEPLVAPAAALLATPAAVAGAASSVAPVAIAAALAPALPAFLLPKLQAASAAAGGPLQSTLWSAAALVAASASAAAPAAFLPPSPSTVQLAGPALATVAATALPPPVVPAPAPSPHRHSVPALMADLRNAPDSMQWCVFGGTAAFLGVIWMAIWLAAGK